MVKLKALLIKSGGVIASLALLIGVSSAQAACVFWFHQPKVPLGMEKFKCNQ